jgi:uncharacterized membrane protein YhhN
MLLIVLAAVYAAWFGLLLRSLCQKPHKRHYTQYKTIVSMGFIGVALACAAKSGAWLLWAEMQPALWLYLAGDILLGLNNRKRDTRLFAAGAFSFFTGHVFLIGAMAARQSLTAWDFVFPVFAAAAVLAILCVVKPSMPEYYYPGMLVYSFTVALFTAKCVHLALSAPTVENLFLAAGSLLFLVSDCAIPFVHFTPRRSLPVHILNLSAYYGGMFLVGASLFFSQG